MQYTEQDECEMFMGQRETQAKGLPRPGSESHTISLRNKYKQHTSVISNFHEDQSHPKFSKLSKLKTKLL